MTVKQIIRMASKLLQKNDIVQIIDEGESANNVEKCLEQMIDCFNSVIVELSEEYFPLKTVQTFSVVDGLISFSSFNQTPLKVVACFMDSQEIQFGQNHLNLSVPNGEVTVVYEYQPTTLTLDDINPYDGTKISSRVIALGVARECLLRDGLYKEATVFDNRFRQAISSVMISKKSKKLRLRGWF